MKLIFALKLGFDVMGGTLGVTGVFGCETAQFQSLLNFWIFSYFSPFSPIYVHLFMH